MSRTGKQRVGRFKLRGDLSGLFVLLALVIALALGGHAMDLETARCSQNAALCLVEQVVRGVAVAAVLVPDQDRAVVRDFLLQHFDCGFRPNVTADSEIV
ncbi:hypothetical protein ebA5489 [Aromatoleum aromaticum EbN1]|uniref:Uncharacterized protein n=1 Tax=Aromatoleum aromaticum (strain DSM 19018 / LMG 30748 / EbN1) TaxID=76114 RepID=Q5P0B4_AROAE|nr:hypothetical protein ebA5489 [Aromatoleum aromaticum EbN1]